MHLWIGSGLRLSRTLVELELMSDGGLLNGLRPIFIFGIGRSGESFALISLLCTLAEPMELLERVRVMAF